MKKIILLIGIVMIVLISGCDEGIPEGEIIECEDTDFMSQERCCYACYKLSYEYLHSTYSRAGWGHEAVDDCFCKIGGKSKQIY